MIRYLWLLVTSLETHFNYLCHVAVCHAFVCLVRLLSDTQSQVSCTVEISNQLDAVNISNGFTYKSQLTPEISEVSPRRGGTAGGTTLTIHGSGFRCSKRT